MIHRGVVIGSHIPVCGVTCVASRVMVMVGSYVMMSIGVGVVIRPVMVMMVGTHMVVVLHVMVRVGLRVMVVIRPGVRMVVMVRPCVEMVVRPVVS